MSLKEQLERRMAGMPPPCVETGATPLTVLVYLSTGETWVFPWSRYNQAHLRGETLTLAFADQEIVIHGQNLERVAKDVAGLSVEILRTISPQYRPLVPANEPFITEIDVRKVHQ